MDPRLDSLLRHSSLIWRGRRGGSPARVWPTGHEALDRLLPGGGWPVGALVELVVPRWGSGELWLWLPLLAWLTRRQRRVVLLSPPHLPYAPALAAAGVALERLVVVEAPPAERPWAMEQLLRSRACALVLAPLAGGGASRRLQLAAASGGSLGVVWLERPAPASHAALRLRLEAAPGGLWIEVLKVRGGRAGGRLWLPREVE